MDFLGVHHPFFLPLWRRIAVAGVCIGWAVLEALLGSELWAVVIGALGIYLVWTLLIVFNADDFKDNDKN